MDYCLSARVIFAWSWLSCFTHRTGHVAMRINTYIPFNLKPLDIVVIKKQEVHSLMVVVSITVLIVHCADALCVCA